jgi:hypothetical protein
MQRGVVRWPRHRTRVPMNSVATKIALTTESGRRLHLSLDRVSANEFELR